jgi:hypothetical protein
VYEHNFQDEFKKRQGTTVALNFWPDGSTSPGNYRWLLYYLLALLRKNVFSHLFLWPYYMCNKWLSLFQLIKYWEAFLPEAKAIAWSPSRDIGLSVSWPFPARAFLFT